MSRSSPDSGQLKRLPAALRCGLLLGAALLGTLSLTASPAVAQTNTGSVTNQDGATYQDGGHTSHTATSNTAILTVGTASESGPGVADVAIALSVSATTIQVQNSLSYTLQVTNKGATDATGTSLTIDGLQTTTIAAYDPLPVHTTFSAFNPSLPAGVTP